MLRPYPAGGEFVDEVACVRNGPGEAAEFCHNERVAATAGGQSLAQSGPVSVRASQTVVDIDPLRLDTERRTRLPLQREILIDGRYPGVADLQLSHPHSMPLRPLHRE